MLGIYDSRKYLQYASRVVNYERKVFIRLITGFERKFKAWKSRSGFLSSSTSSFIFFDIKHYQRFTTQAGCWQQALRGFKWVGGWNDSLSFSLSIVHFLSLSLLSISLTDLFLSFVFHLRNKGSSLPIPLMFFSLYLLLGTTLFILFHSFHHRQSTYPF